MGNYLAGSAFSLFDRSKKKEEEMESFITSKHSPFPQTAPTQLSLPTYTHSRSISKYIVGKPLKSG